MPRPVAMRFVTLDNGCMVCISHKPRHCGYLQKGWVINGKLVLEQFHRFIYKARVGPIPEGFDIDHLCHNRLCCNPEHLECLSKDEHRRRPKYTSKWGKSTQARLVWDQGGITRKELATLFGVPYTTARSWVQKWSKNVPVEV